MFFVREAKSGKVTTKNRKKIVWKGEFLFRGSSILWKLNFIVDLATVLLERPPRAERLKTTFVFGRGGYGGGNMI